MPKIGIVGCGNVSKATRSGIPIPTSTTRGGGPLMDMGPYYLTCLVNLLAPVKSVAGQTKSPCVSRTIGSGPREDQRIEVEVATHVSAVLEFASGAAKPLTTSFDIGKHDHNHVELYCTIGSMILPDPNKFADEVKTAHREEDRSVAQQIHPYGDVNYRILGLADLAEAIVSNRHIAPIRTTSCTSLRSWNRSWIPRALTCSCARPEPMRTNLPLAFLNRSAS